MTTVLGLDVGTQGTKGVLVDAEDREVVARASDSYDLIPDLPVGAAEQHPDRWIEAITRVAADLWSQQPHRREDLAAIGVSGQQHGLVVLDSEGQIVRPAKLWCDTSTAGEASRLSEELGRPIPTGFTASKIRWLATHEPSNWARVRSVLLPHDFVNYRLTGIQAMEAGDASGTAFFDPVSRAFSMDDAAVIDARLPDLLPPVIAAGEPCGVLSPDGASILGVDPGVLVSTGGGDNMMSAIGAGATRDGVVIASLGTSGTVFTRVQQSPLLDNDGLIAPFCDSTGAWLPLLCVMNLTGVTEEVRAAFGMDHTALTEAASSVDPGCDGLLWIPYLQGERVPDLPNATGSLIGMRPGTLRAGHLYRAALEGTSLNLAWGVDRLRALGVMVDEVRLVGGAAGNPLWREILAAAFEADVQPLAEPESGALGAALHALWTSRRVAGHDLSIDQIAAPYVKRTGAPTRPKPPWIAAYREQMERFKAAVERIS